jgi:DNA-binding NtrC family response regulator
MRLAVPSILITDDDRHFRETLRAVLETRGFRTFLAEDGEAALEVVSHEEVHLVLLDMHMPRLSGLETIQRVKQLKSRLPCILISAGLDECLAQQALRAEAFSVLAKPITRLQLTSVVNRAFERTYNWDVLRGCEWPGAGDEPT